MRSTWYISSRIRCVDTLCCRLALPTSPPLIHEDTKCACMWVLSVGGATRMILAENASRIFVSNVSPKVEMEHRSSQSNPKSRSPSWSETKIWQEQHGLNTAAAAARARIDMSRLCFALIHQQLVESAGGVIVFQIRTTPVLARRIWL